jgi:hypothetical protein
MYTSNIILDEAYLLVTDIKLTRSQERGFFLKERKNIALKQR